MAACQARLDVLDAESEGQLGYVLEMELANALVGRQVAALLTQVVVDPADPAFQHPTKPVGPHYSRQVGGGREQFCLEASPPAAAAAAAAAVLSSSCPPSTLP